MKISFYFFYVLRSEVMVQLIWKPFNSPIVAMLLNDLAHIIQQVSCSECIQIADENKHLTCYIFYAGYRETVLHEHIILSSHLLYITSTLVISFN